MAALKRDNNEQEVGGSAYAIARGRTMEKLVDAVNDALAKGYHPIGGVSQIDDGGFADKMFIQAVVKKDNLKHEPE